MERRHVLYLVVAIGLAWLVYQFYFQSLYSGITAHGGVSATTVQPGDTIQVWIDSIDGGLYDNPHVVSYSTDSQTGWCGTGSDYGGYYCMAPVSVTSWWENSVCDPVSGYGYLMAAATSSSVSFDPTYNDFSFKEVYSAGFLYYGFSDVRTTSLKPFNDGGTPYDSTFYLDVDLRWYDQSRRTVNYFVGACGKSGYPSLTYVRSDNGSSYVGDHTFTSTVAGTTVYCKVLEISPPSSSTYDTVEYKVVTRDAFYPVIGIMSTFGGGSGYITYKLRLKSIRYESGFLEAYIDPAGDGGSFGGTIPVYNCTFRYTVSNNGCTISLPTRYDYTVSSSASEGNYQFLFHVRHVGYCYLADMTPVVFNTSQTGNYLDGAEFQVVDYADTVTINSVSASVSDDEVAAASITVSGGATFDRVDISSSCGGSTSISKSSFSCSGSTCTWSGSLGLDTSTSGEVSSTSTSCTVTAKLIVNGSQVDSDSKTVTVYFPQVQSLSVPDTSSTTVSYSFRACGVFSGYRVYLDSLSNQVASKSLSPPSSPGGCRDVSDSVVIDGLTSGSHTLYIRLFTSDGGEYDTRSDTFNANITYSGSVSVQSPSDGQVIDQQVDVPGTPSQSVNTSASYSTDAPSATLKLYVNGAEKQSWSVTGSGTKSYSVPSMDLTCGSDTFDWRLYSGSDLLASDSVAFTLRCWYDSVGPSGSVQVPSVGGSPLPDSYVDVYVDASVTPETDYSIRLLWNGTDISSLLATDGCSHTACARVHPSDVGGFTCGQSVSLQADLLEGSDVRATASSTITLNCVEQYVIVREPSDGTAFDLQGQSVPSDFEVNVAVDYAGGDTLAFLVNGSDANAVPYASCDYDACYSVSGPFTEGNNTITVRLYNGQSLVSEDNVDVIIYLWSFLTTVDYGTDTALVVTREYGSHASRCEMRVGDANSFSAMLYDGSSAWNYQVSRDYDGSSYEVRCYSPTGVLVYDYNDTFNFSSGSGGAGGGGGVFTKPEVAEVPKSLPIWPATASVGDYTWSILDGSGIESGTFTSASVSSKYVCVGSKDVPSVSVCTGDVPGIPSSKGSLASLVDSLKSSCHAVTPTKVGDLYCVINEGAGLYVFRSGGSVLPVLLAKRGVSVGVYYYIAAGLALALIAYLVLGSRT